jgi:hypothetical protein
VRNALVAGAVGAAAGVAVYEGAKYLLRNDHGSMPYQNKNYYFNNDDAVGRRPTVGQL